MQFETLIHARTPRVRCADHKVKVIELPWATKGSHFTLLFEAFAIDDLKTLAQEALDQIDAKGYTAEMAAEGVTDVLKLGLAFHGKSVELVKG